jgi:hypothetical protein
VSGIGAGVTGFLGGVIAGTLGYDVVFVGAGIHGVHRRVRSARRAGPDPAEADSCYHKRAPSFAAAEATEARKPGG